MALALLSDLKARLGIDGAGQDALLVQALRGAGAALAAHCGREFEYEDEDAVEYFDGGGWDLRLRRFPVVGAPVLRLALNHDFAGAAALVEAVDYVVNGTRGVITRLPERARWPGGRGVLQVTYRGGYVAPGTAQPPTGTRPVPAHVQEAALLTAADLYKRRDEPGYKVVWSAGEVSGGYAPGVELLPLVKTLLRAEQR